MKSELILTNIDDFIHNLLKTMRLSSSIHVIQDLKSGVEILYLDQNRFRDGLILLIENAFEALRKKQKDPKETTGRLVIESLKINHQLEVRLGCGISQRNLEKNFEPQLSGNGSHLNQGLAAIREFTDRQDWEIEIISEAYKETTVIIRLPIRNNGACI